MAEEGDFEMDTEEAEEAEERDPEEEADEDEEMGAMKGVYMEECMEEEGEEIREFCECSYDYLVQEHGEDVLFEIEEDEELADEAAEECIEYFPM